MIKRTLYFGNPAYLNLADGQLKVRFPEIQNSPNLPQSFKSESVASIPIEDIGVIVLDDKQITLTQGLMQELFNKNVALVTCDDTHHPIGLSLPLAANTIQTERYRDQIAASEPLKKQLWAQTVEQKIFNQYKHLNSIGINAGFLKPILKNIKSGDSGNSEGIAAAHYWKSLSPFLLNNNETEFKRGRNELPPNNYLNYGYAILRAVMARSIVAAGLLPALGIFHKNRYNAYCLADDLMEPYRPLVDQHVISIIKNFGLNEGIPKEVKSQLLQIPTLDVIIADEQSPLMLATQKTAVSLVNCFSGKQRKLAYPVFEK